MSRESRLQPQDKIGFFFQGSQKIPDACNSSFNVAYHAIKCLEITVDGTKKNHTAKQVPDSLELVIIKFDKNVILSYDPKTTKNLYRRLYESLA